MGLPDSSPPIIPSDLVDLTDFYSRAVAVGQNDSIYIGGTATTPNNSSEPYPYAFLQIPADGLGSITSCSGYWDNTNAQQAITNLFLLPNGTLAFAGYGNEGVGVGRYKQPSSCALDELYGTNGIWYSTNWTSLDDAWFETDGSVDLRVSTFSLPTSLTSLVHIDPDGQQTAAVDLPLCFKCDDTDTYDWTPSITRAPDNRYLALGRLQPASNASTNASMVVAYYTSDLKPDMSVGNHGIVTIPVSAAWIFGLRAVYTPDGSRTVVVGRMPGGNLIEHLVVARIWN
ncbi:MAG: hypothetical protein FWD73_11805 [Polyangiaceae bacterium]|nr:hypothetical protein [Polyangiaceae bacterium]